MIDLEEEVATMFARLSTVPDFGIRKLAAGFHALTDHIDPTRRAENTAYMREYRKRPHLIEHLRTYGREQARAYLSDPTHRAARNARARAARAATRDGGR